MTLKISNIIYSDIYIIEQIGKICLPIYYSSIDIFFLLYDDNYVLFKINLDNKIIGFIIACKKYKTIQEELNNTNTNRTKIIRFHIMSIGILPQYRKQGYGSILLNYLQQYINKNYHYPIITSLYVLTTNTAAIKLYEKYNFIKKFKNENYYTNLLTKSAYYYET